MITPYLDPSFRFPAPSTPVPRQAITVLGFWGIWIPPRWVFPCERAARFRGSLQQRINIFENALASLLIIHSLIIFNPTRHVAFFA